MEIKHIPIAWLGSTFEDLKVEYELYQVNSYHCFLIVFGALSNGFLPHTTNFLSCLFSHLQPRNITPGSSLAKLVSVAQLISHLLFCATLDDQMYTMTKNTMWTMWAQHL